MKKIVRDIIKEIEKNNKIALFMHKNPDGDSISSSYGLALALKSKFPKKTIKVVSDIDYLKKNFSLINFDKKMFTKKIDSSFLSIIGDAGVAERILNYDEFKKAKKNICFDHHIDKSNFKPNLYWQEENFGASALQAIEIAFALNCPIDSKTAVSLLFGVLTDTGFFRFTGNDPLPPASYAKLLKYVTKEDMNELFINMSTKNKNDIKLQSYIYKKIKYYKDVAYVVFENSVIKKFGYSSIKMKVNSIANIEGTTSWAFFVKTTNESGKLYKVSLRSSRKNIQEVANLHSGGGHVKASGCIARNKSEIKEIVRQMSEAKKEA